MVVRWAAVVAFVLAATVAVVTAPVAQADDPPPPTCAPDPGPVNESITNDAAIEVHGLRREMAEHCAALHDRLTEAVVQLEALGQQLHETNVQLSDPAFGVQLAATERNALSLAWWSGWAVVGLLLTLIVAPSFTRAFRFWRE